MEQMLLGDCLMFSQHETKSFEQMEAIPMTAKKNGALISDALPRKSLGEGTIRRKKDRMGGA
jgi:hypothetical protein